MAPEITVAAEETPPPVVTEAVAEAAVEIAQIEADRDIALATIHTESNEAQTDAVLEQSAAETDEDVAWLKAELAYLRTQCETNGADLLSEREARTLLQQQMTIQGEQIAALLLLTPLPNLAENQPPAETPASDGAEDGPRENPAPDSDPAEETPPAPADKRRRRFLQ